MTASQERSNTVEPEAEFTFTIFIPTFNRAHTLPRAFESIEKQTWRDFEVLIVDDGSTDDTKELVDAWRDRVDFPVRYHWQPNQGKHAAHNTALKFIRGYFTVVLDSDDMLVPNALERFKFHWDQIPESERGGYAGIEGLCAFMEDERISGGRFPQAVFDSNYIQMRRRLGIRGDKKGALRTTLLRRFPYPQFEGERHIRPSLLWERLAQHYRTRYINEVVQLIEYQPGGLSDDRFGLRMRNPRGFRYYYREQINVHEKKEGLRRRLDSHVKYVRYSLHCGVGVLEQAREVDSTLLWLASVPQGTLIWLRDKIKMRRRKI